MKVYYKVDSIADQLREKIDRAVQEIDFIELHPAEAAQLATELDSWAREPGTPVSPGIIHDGVFNGVLVKVAGME